MVNKWPGLAVIVVIMAGAGLFFWIALEGGQPAPPLPEPAPAISEPIAIPDHIRLTLHAGDLIFRGKDFSWGDLGARVSDRDQRFGHVGVIVGHEGDWAVIDAIGNPLEAEGQVRLRSLADFLAPATRMGLYRPALTEAELARFLDEIWRYEAANTPFDRFYDLQDHSALYCSELIWLALKTATGKDQIIEHTNFRGRRVIAIDDLQYAPIMDDVWTFDRNS